MVIFYSVKKVPSLTLTYPQTKDALHFFGGILMDQKWSNLEKKKKRLIFFFHFTGAKALALFLPFCQTFSMDKSIHLDNQFIQRSVVKSGRALP